MKRKKITKIFMSLLFNTLIFSSVIGFKAYAQDLEGEFNSLLEKYKNENVIIENGLSLYVNDTIDLSEHPNWDILDTSIVSIDENGILTAHNNGTTYISQKINGTVYIAEISICNDTSSILRAIDDTSVNRNYYKVFLDPGHGGSDPGAIANGIYEDELNLSIGLKVEKLLKAQGIDVKMSRTTDTFLSLSERAKLANNYGGDAFVSIHNNAFASSSAYGIETYYSAAKPTSKKLSTPIQNNIVSETNGYNRGVKTADHVVTKNTTMPASLVEGGFLTNPSEAAKLKTTSYQNQLAKGIADGIVKYLKDNVPLQTSNITNIKGKVTTNSLNIRSGASTSYSIVGTLKTNDTVEILETLNGWYKIKYNNVIGYVSSQYISVGTDTGSSSNSTTTKTGKVTTSSLNIRSGAGTSYSIIGTLKTNDTVEILETLNGWYKIKYNNVIGYVSSQYISANTISNFSLNLTTTKTGKVTTSSLNIRSGAGTSYSIIGTLKTNDTVEILETLNGWYKIRYNNVIGYVSSQYIKIN